jgi:arylsulfatase B
VGNSDFSHNTEAKSPIPSPNVEALAKDGIELQQHYMHNLCTPSRAALLTGRYHVNTGLIFVLTPGTPAGLPSDVPTLPEVLKEKAGYSTAMVGKWHLGHSQHKLTPTGKGFDTFTGMYTDILMSFNRVIYLNLPYM